MYLPFASMTVAPAGAAATPPTREIRPFSIRTAVFGCSAPVRTLMTVPPWMNSAPPACAGAGACPAVRSPTAMAIATTNIPAAERYRLISPPVALFKSNDEGIRLREPPARTGVEHGDGEGP